MVFSSSATVYGQPEKIPCVEDFSLKAMNPYGRTKVYLNSCEEPYLSINTESRLCNFLCLAEGLVRNFTSCFWALPAFS